MITAIEKIYGVGRYSHYDGPVALGKNQVIFGFNGAGKSTLSDIFYSLKNDEAHLELLPQRFTLPADSGETPESQSVVLSTDGESLTFDGSRWNRSLNIHVFNDQYIDEYLFIGDSYADGGCPVGLGPQETRKLNQRQACEQKFQECLETINQVIVSNKETCRKVKLGQNRISMDKWEKRARILAKISQTRPTQREQIRRWHDEPNMSSPNLDMLRAWSKQLEQFPLLFDTERAKLFRKLPGILLDTPEITGREISEHMQKSMARQDLLWLAQGRRYQKRENLCPFCGQEITSPDFAGLAKDLDRFIRGKKKDKAAALRQSTETAMVYLAKDRLEALQNLLEEICNANEGVPFLYRRTLSLVETLRFHDDVSMAAVHTLSEKLKWKIQNPYERIELQQGEADLCALMEKILQKLDALREKLKEEQKRCTERLQSEQEYEYQAGLYEIFFGPNAELFQQAMDCANEMNGLHQQICTLTKELGDMVDRHKLDDVNSFLEEVNVNFTVAIENNAYRVKIRGYEPSVYQKGNKLLCSEGERRMLAFAYFLQEVQEDPEDKIVVVDDPVSSMDSSRRSVVAYKLATLMQEENSQVIVLTHDLFFADRLNALDDKLLKDYPMNLLQINKYGTPFAPLVLEDYLISDSEVYEQIVRSGMESEKKEDKLVALMAMRPYAYLLTTDQHDRDEIEKKGSYLAHSRYARSRDVRYEAEAYTQAAMQAYCQEVSEKTGKGMDMSSLCPAELFGEDGAFPGFDYDSAWSLYEGISMDSMLEIRKKALVFRLVLETSLYMLREASKPLNLERIGTDYNNLKKKAKQPTKNPEWKEKNRLSLMLCKLYEFSKKYHHGANAGSTLGLSSLNPEEMVQYDREIREIHDWITVHPKPAK